MLFFAWKAPRQNSLTSSTKTSGSELTDIRGVAGGGGGGGVPYLYPILLVTLVLFPPYFLQVSYILLEFEWLMSSICERNVMLYLCFKPRPSCSKPD